MTEMSSGMDIDKYLFSQETRNEIIKEAGVNANAFSVTLTRLRKAGILLADNKINPKIIPDLKRGCKKFDFIIIFDINRDDVE